MKKTKIKIAIPSLVMIVALIFSGDTVPLLAVFSAATLHELGHVVAAKALGIRFSEFSLSLLGARLNTETKLISYKSEMILALSGPLVNIFCFAAFLPQALTQGAGGAFLSCFCSYFCAASITLGVLNLLPISTFDGGRIVYSATALIKDDITARKISRSLSFICLIFLWSASVYLLIKTGSSLSLFTFSLTLFARLFINE